LPCGLLLVGRATLHDVEGRAADDVAPVLRPAVGPRENPGADLELRRVDVAAQCRAGLEVHRRLAGVERIRRAGVVDTGVVEVPAVDAGLPPVQDGLSGGVVVDDLRRAVVTPVAVVGIEGARGREKLLEEPSVDRWAEAPTHGLPARVFL